MRHYRRFLPLMIVAGLACMSYTTATLLSNPNCPTSYTGAPKATTPSLGQVRYCTSCHSSYALNVAGGGITVTGLPTTTYTPGQVYTFSITINHAAANRKNWGYAIKAVNTVNNYVVGTFTTTNTNSSVKGTASGNTMELSHATAATTANAATYTYNNLKWTAPAVPGVNDTHIRFYIIANAGDGLNNEGGDYIYTKTIDVSLSTLPVTLSAFNVDSRDGKTVTAHWTTQQEINSASFELESSTNGSTWNTVGSVAAKGSSDKTSDYTFTDAHPVFNTSLSYRLKQTDRDGSYKYSEVKTIRLKNTGIVINTLNPQPLHAGTPALFEVQSASATPMTITIFNMAGTTISQKNTMIETGVNRVEMPLGLNAARGMYFVKFSTPAGWEQTIRQVIQ